MTNGTPACDKLEETEQQLRRRLGYRVIDLRILIQDGRIVLRGRASTYHAKQLAQHAVMELLQLPISANEIEVS